MITRIVCSSSAEVRSLGEERRALHARHAHPCSLAFPVRCVQRRLEHANLSITLDTYPHVELHPQAAVAARVAALLIAAHLDDPCCRKSVTTHDHGTPERTSKTYPHVPELRKRLLRFANPLAVMVGAGWLAVGGGGGGGI